jgi:RNA polymerase sigma-B factor
VSDQPFAALNATLLERYRTTGDHRARNRLVELNLPLVKQLADRLSRTTTLPFEDLLQLGCLGLIRAIERFDPSCGEALSSYAVPYIRGAMQHHLRDQHPPLRCSRLLRDLYRRGQTLQLQRLHQQLPALAEQDLAEQLGCRLERWRDACSLHWALRICSLDAPAPRRDGLVLPLGELIEARDTPHPCRPDSPVLSACCEAEPQHWLRQRLGRLDPSHRELLEGRVLGGASWRELGERLGLKARAAQKCCEALLAQLRQELGVELADLFEPTALLEGQAFPLRPATGPGPSPGLPRSGSEAH